MGAVWELLFGLASGFDVVGIGVGWPCSVLCFGVVILGVVVFIDVGVGVVIGVVIWLGVRVWRWDQRQGTSLIRRLDWHWGSERLGV